MRVTIMSKSYSGLSGIVTFHTKKLFIWDKDNLYMYEGSAVR